ncbi:hypothetical protein HGB24_01130 [Candidatus Saccharibacteria bacterium]|nr:hypothetical protein [Candidatus Saccharibacteria bacterium]
MKLFKPKAAAETPRRRQMNDSSLDAASNSPADNAFRRNRTITNVHRISFDDGLASSDTPSSRLHVHHLTVKRRKAFGLFAVIVIGIIFLWTIISNFTASSVVVYNTTITSPIDQARYTKVIQDYLNENPISRFTFLMDNNNFNDYMIGKLSELDSITPVGMGGIGTTNFKINLRKPVAGWKIKNKQYYVDAKGVSFEVNYYSEPAVQIVDESGAVIQATGTEIISNRFLGYVGRVVAIASDYGYTVTQATLPAGMTRELDIKVQGSGSTIKLVIDRPVGEQIEDMARSLRYLASRGINASYIDVRVSGKAFYQ